MVAEKKRTWGLLAAWHASCVVAFMPFTGTQIDANEANPFKGNEPENPAVARIKAFIAKRVWAAATRTAGK